MEPSTFESLSLRTALREPAEEDSVDEGLVTPTDTTFSSPDTERAVAEAAAGVASAAGSSVTQKGRRQLTPLPLDKKAVDETKKMFNDVFGNKAKRIGDSEKRMHQLLKELGGLNLGPGSARSARRVSCLMDMMEVVQELHGLRIELAEATYGMEERIERLMQDDVGVAVTELANRFPVQSVQERDGDFDFVSSSTERVV